MMVVTPGLDLQPITTGADYAFVLDLSGSMAGKLDMVVRGVTAALHGLTPDDRFRLVTFQTQARMLTPDWVLATAEHIERTTGQLEQLRTGGSTNLYDGLALALHRHHGGAAGACGRGRRRCGLRRCRPARPPTDPQPPGLGH